MSRIEELKKQYPELNLTMFDVFKSMDPTNSYKYFPLLCKIFSKRWRLNEQYPKDEIPKVTMEFKTLFTRLGMDIENFTPNQSYFLRHLMDFHPNEHFEIFREFINLVENNRVENKDVTSYNSLDEIRKTISLASIKGLNKELEKQVIKEFEDDKWVIVRPLTFAASSKYGSTTRWCTTYQTDKGYFERYWRQGILVYFINKTTGYKFAGYKSLSDSELSFWNAEDTRVDYLDLDTDDYLFPIVRRIFKSQDTNKNLCTHELQEKVHQECIGDIENQLRPVPANYELPTIRTEDAIRTIDEALNEMDLDESRVVGVNLINDMTWTSTSTIYPTSPTVI